MKSSRVMYEENSGIVGGAVKAAAAVLDVACAPTPSVTFA